MADCVRMRGSVVKGVTVWTGPVPPDSFTYYAPGVRMSTAEYFFLRKVNQLSLPKAVRLGNELCGKYRSSDTGGCAPTDDYTFMRVPRTDTDYIGSYLSRVADTEEGKRALEVLGLVVDGSASPMASYLHIHLTLPTGPRRLRPRAPLGLQGLQGQGLPHARRKRGIPFLRPVLGARAGRPPVHRRRPALRP
jgi:hypothetical protein